jgi:peptidoglycan/LPS O-acetylase OafA/YrhL
MARIHEFEATRGLMSLWVMLGHTCAAMAYRLPAPVPQNLSARSAVDVFIILSGFVIVLLLVERGENYRTFLTRRFFRLVPVYVACLVVSALLMDLAVLALERAPMTDATPGRLKLLADSQEGWVLDFISHLSLLHGLMSRVLPQAQYTILGQAWSVSVEWQFYLVAPMVVATFWRREFFSALALTLILILVPKIAGGGSGSAIRNAHLFALGILYYGMWSKAKTSPAGWTLSTVRGLSMGAVFGSLIFFDERLPVMLWVGIAHIAFVRSLVNDSGGLEAAVSRVLDNRALAYLGKISYSVYLTHMIVLYPVLYLLSTWVLAPWIQAVAMLVLVPSGTVLLSAATFVWIERPGMRIGSRVVESWTTAPQEAVKSDST